MLKKSLLSIAVIAASVASVSAFAADQTSKLPQQKVYVGANVAYAGINYDSIAHLVQQSTPYAAEQGNFGWGVDAGYAYKIMPSFYLGADLGYQDNGKSTGTAGSDNFKIRSHMVTLLAKADYYVMPSWDVFGKFGPAYVMQTSTTTDVKNTTNKIRPYIGVGTGYTFDNGIYTNIAYDHLFGSTGNDDGSFAKGAKPAIRSVNIVQLSVGYNFAV